MRFPFTNEELQNGLRRFAFAVLLVLIACRLVRPAPKPQPPAERRVTLYPGVCPADQTWYLFESTDSSVTVACWDDNYQPPDDPGPDPDPENEESKEL